MELIDDHEQQFRDLFDKTYRPLLAYCLRRVANRSEAEDIVSDVYTTTWRRRHEIDWEGLGMPWLYRVAANTIRNHYRSGQRRQNLQERAANQAQIDLATTNDPAALTDTAEVTQALAALSADDQEILRLVAWEGLSHHEIAHIFDISPNAVGIRVHRARKRLSHHLATDNNATTSEQER